MVYYSTVVNKAKPGKHHKTQQRTHYTVQSLRFQPEQGLLQIRYLRFTGIRIHLLRCSCPQHPLPRQQSLPLRPPVTPLLSFRSPPHATLLPRPAHAAGVLDVESVWVNVANVRVDIGVLSGRGVGLERCRRLVCPCVCAYWVSCWGAHVLWCLRTDTRIYDGICLIDVYRIP